MNLIQLAEGKPLLALPTATVGRAVDVALEARVGAIAVVEDGKVVGIFTERDVMTKVVKQRLDPDTTLLRDVMSSPVHTVPPTMHAQEALQTMLERHVRHLVISADGKRVDGIVSIRNVMQFLLDYLQKNLKQMESYLGR